MQTASGKLPRIDPLRRSTGKFTSTLPHCFPHASLSALNRNNCHHPRSQDSCSFFFCSISWPAANNPYQDFLLSFSEPFDTQTPRIEPKTCANRIYTSCLSTNHRVGRRLNGRLRGNNLRPRPDRVPVLHRKEKSQMLLPLSLKVRYPTNIRCSC